MRKEFSYRGYQIKPVGVFWVVFKGEWEIEQFYTRAKAMTSVDRAIHLSPKSEHKRRMNMKRMLENDNDD